MGIFYIGLSVVLGLIALYCALHAYDAFSWRKCIGSGVWLFDSGAMVAFGWLSWLSWVAA